MVGMASLGFTVGGRALLVGTFNGIPGQYATIQAAVDAAQPGDWILVAPGDYHENSDITNPPTSSDISEGWYGGVDVTTSNLHIRGMDRNSVIVDGTKSTASAPCSSTPADQNFGSSTTAAPRPAGTGSWCGRRTTSASRTSPPATSSRATVTPATRSGGTAPRRRTAPSGSPASPATT